MDRHWRRAGALRFFHAGRRCQEEFLQMTKNINLEM
nr:MAG TPA: hypothetical protein [Inoviridae sp.]